MAKREVIIEPYEDTKKWLCTFNDLMTLLLTFFVLILSMSTMSSKKVMEFSDDFIKALGVMEAGKAKEETIIEQIYRLEEIGKRPASMTTEEKTQLVRILERKGAFQIRGVVNQVAVRLGVTNFTIYNYLKKIRAINGTMNNEIV